MSDEEKAYEWLVMVADKRAAEIDRLTEYSACCGEVQAQPDGYHED